MFKTNLRPALAGCVLLAGLVSCSPENKHTKDVYVAPPPKIQQPGGVVDLKSWDLLKTKTLDLQDLIDVSEAAPASVRVRSNCRRGGEHFSAVGVFRGRLKLPVWLLLPEAILGEDIGSLDCEFELNLFNGAGSNHVFNIPPVSIQEARPASVALGGEPPEAGLRYDLAQLQSVRARFANQSAAAAHVACRDFALRPLPFESVIDLSHFDFLGPIQNQSEEQRPPRRLQSCRVVISEHGERRAISRIFQIVLPRPGLKIESQPAPLRAPATISSAAETLNAVTGGMRLILAAWKITNTDQIQRIFRIPEAGFRLTLNMFMEMGDSPVSISRFAIANMPYTFPWIHLERNPADGVRSGVIALSPGESAELFAVLAPAGQMRCKSVMIKPKGLLLNGFETLQLDEVSAEGDKLAAIRLEIGEPIELSPVTLPPLSRMTTLAPEWWCAWP
jgi:hypothetical protein